MSAQTIQVTLPGSLYQQIKARAQVGHRDIGDEVVEMLRLMLPAEESLPPRLAEAVAGLDGVDDDALWAAARATLSGTEIEELEALHLQQRLKPLSSHEQRREEQLRQAYQRCLLVRATAARLLKERGHDISPLLFPV